MLDNIHKTEFSKQKVSKWGENIFTSDATFYQPGWIDKLLDLLPYKEHTNFMVDPQLLYRLNLYPELDDKLQEKVYVYADFIAPGNHNASILYNSNEDPSMATKNIYTTIINAKPREHKIDLKYKKIKQFRVERVFQKEASMFKDWKEVDLRLMISTDLEYSKISRVVPDSL